MFFRFTLLASWRNLFVLVTNLGIILLLQEAAAAKPADEAEINPELTKVTWTSEKEKAEAEGEDKPLKGVEED